jgi:hypothetical protein
MMHRPFADIGYLHVLDWYMHRERLRLMLHNTIKPHLSHLAVNDFDITTERREGWTYDHNL